MKEDLLDLFDFLEEKAKKEEGGELYIDTNDFVEVVEKLKEFGFDLNFTKKVGGYIINYKKSNHC